MGQCHGLDLLLIAVFCTADDLLLKRPSGSSCKFCINVRDPSVWLEVLAVLIGEDGGHWDGFQADFGFGGGSCRA